MDAGAPTALGSGMSMNRPEINMWRLSLAAPVNGILFTAWGDPLDMEGVGLPEDLVGQVTALQAEARAFWRRAVEDMARDPRRPPNDILRDAGAAEIQESAEALIVAISMARPDILLDVDITLSV
jgi:hypothetical protein